ncbi:hypothetical protein ACGTNG_10335 [Halomonas sp. 1390]
MQGGLWLPATGLPVAYPCLVDVGHVLELREFETTGWRSRTPLEDLVACKRWG